MIERAIDRLFGGSWIHRNPNGVYSIAGGMADLTANNVGDGCILDWYLPVWPGEHVEFDCHARVVTGTALLGLDLFDTDTFESTPEIVTVTTQDWQRVRVGTTIPLTVSTTAILRVALGISSTVTGRAQFLAPALRTSHGVGALPSLAAGLLRVLSGVASFDPAVPSHGFAGASRIDANTVTVTLSHGSRSTLTPRVQATGTWDHFQGPRIGGVVGGASPTFNVRWSSGAAWADISTSNWFAYLHVE